MWTAIITVLLTFILTGILGNFVVQAWQHHNWLVQRRILEAEEQYKALQKTFDEVSELAGKRQHRMFRLLSSLWGEGDDVVRKRLSDYDESATMWNERLAAQYAKITMQLDYWLTLRLDREIQPRFVRLDAELTRLTTARLNGVKLSSADFGRLSQALNALQGQIIGFNKATLKQIDDKKVALYRPKDFNLGTLDSFPTWELFKALFKPRKHSLDIL
jgi:hypothetical protein